MKEYTVYFHGSMTVEAKSEDEATSQAYDELNDGSKQFTITSAVAG